MPTPKSPKVDAEGGDGATANAASCLRTAATEGVAQHTTAANIRKARSSVSNENNFLLDPEVLTCYPTQALLLTVLVILRVTDSSYHSLQIISLMENNVLQATLVRNTTDENESRILYEYLAEASVVFPKVFPVMYVSTFAS